MDLERFNEFRDKSQMLIRSSNWITDQIGIVIDKVQSLPDDADNKIVDELLDDMGYLQQKASWEDIQHEKLINEYKDVISND